MVKMFVSAQGAAGAGGNPPFHCGRAGGLETGMTLPSCHARLCLYQRFQLSKHGIPEITEFDQPRQRLLIPALSPQFT